MIEYIDHPQDCQPILQGDTEGTPGCGAMPGGGDEDSGDGVDEGSGSGGGESGESSGGVVLEPFGDLDTLMTCTAPSHCTVDPALFVAVQSNFGIVHDEGVRLDPVELPTGGRGLRLSGLDRGEASAALLGALGLANGDVITHVDGAPILGDGTIERVLLELPTATAWA